MLIYYGRSQVPAQLPVSPRSSSHARRPSFWVPDTSRMERRFGADDWEEEAPLRVNGLRRVMTLPELETAAEGVDGHRRNWTAEGLRQHRGDESDCRRHDSGGGSRYTSLRDLMQPPSSPSPTAVPPPYFPIRNRLVKHAAHAYLQPMAALSPKPSAAEGCFSWLCGGWLIPAIRRWFSRRKSPAGDQR